MANGNGNDNGNEGPKTRGGLVPAKIYEKDNTNNCVNCMFNPFEYKISKKNVYKERKGASGKNPILKFTGTQLQTLGIDLLFDTYESGENLGDTLDKLWGFMAPQGSGVQDPPLVIFEWGSLYFEAVIEEMSHHFTLFNKDGIPLRAKVRIDFKQRQLPQQPRQNPTSGGGPLNRVRTVYRHDRLDLIADQEFGDSSKWRLIADYNELDDPLVLRPGQRLRIPEDVT